MGYENMIYRAKRVKDITIEDIKNVKAYRSYIDNEWNLKNYPTWEDYVRNYTCDGRIIPKPPQDLIDFYADEDDREYCVANWCSSGRCFAEEMNRVTDHGKKELGKEEISEMLSYCKKILEKNELIPVIIDRAFTEKDNVITSVPCNGVEVEDEEGRLKRIYTDNWEYTMVYIPKKCYDEEEVMTIQRLQDCLEKILATADFDKEIYYFEESY